jgi:hypothetical protein
MAKRQKEGRRIKSLSPLTSLIPYIMVERNDSQNHIHDSFEITKIEEMIREMRQEGYDSIGVLHFIIGSYVRMVSQRPQVNRFIRGQKFYARNGIVVNMAIKRTMSLEENETTIKMKFKPTDTIYDVYKTINDAINEGINGPTDADGAAKIINYIPGLLKKFTVWFLKMLDYFGLIPNSLIEASPFHGSMFITNMASLNIPPILHHLYNFGNVPLFFAFGAKRMDVTYKRNGEPVMRKVVDIIFNLDERICEGYYFASALKMLKHYMEHPELLKEPPKEVIEDVR